MTDLTERLRAMSRLQHSDYTIGEEAADEIDTLQATVAGLRKSASLRVQFHAAELADVTAERDMWKDTLAQRDRELANARAIDIHSCGPTCMRAGCVAAGLREDAERYRWLRNKIYIEPDRCILRIWDVFLREADGKLPIALDAAIDAARKAAP